MKTRQHGAMDVVGVVQGTMDVDVVDVVGVEEAVDVVDVGGGVMGVDVMGVDVMGVDVEEAVDMGGVDVVECTHVGTVRGADVAETVQTVLEGIGYTVRAEGVNGSVECWDLWVEGVMEGDEYCVLMGMVRGIAATVRHLEGVI
jgi:hypothetical protein